jgi:hypothetical protein
MKYPNAGQSDFYCLSQFFSGGVRISLTQQMTRLTENVEKAISYCLTQSLGWVIMDWMKAKRLGRIVWLSTLLLVAGTAGAEDGDTKGSLDLVKASQNPLANLAGVPFRLNIYPNVTANPGGSPTTGAGPNPVTGPQKGPLSTVDINPVMPFQLDHGWLLLARLKQPVSLANDVYQPNSRQFGLGDANPSVYLTPGPWGAVTLGFGGAMQLPTATNGYLGQGKWAAGPALVGMWTPGPFLLGALVQNLWSFAGQADRPSLNTFNIQPMFSYSLCDGWFIQSQPFITIDWTAPRGQRFSVPVGGSLGKLMIIGSQALTLTAGAFAYPVT